MKSKSAKVNGSAGSRWRRTSSCSEWKVPSGSLSRRRISSGRYSASSGSLLGSSSETGIRPTCRSSSRTSCSRRATRSGWRCRKLLTSNERRRVAVGGGERELVVVLELLEHLSHLDQEEPGRDRLDLGRLDQRQLAAGRDEDQCAALGGGHDVAPSNTCGRRWMGRSPEGEEVHVRLLELG